MLFLLESKISTLFGKWSAVNGSTVRTGTGTIQFINCEYVYTYIRTYVHTWIYMYV